MEINFLKNFNNDYIGTILQYNVSWNYKLQFLKIFFQSEDKTPGFYFQILNFRSFIYWLDLRFPLDVLKILLSTIGYCSFDWTLCLISHLS